MILESYNTFILHFFEINLEENQLLSFILLYVKSITVFHISGAAKITA